MKCPKCNATDHEPGAKFRHKCGSPLNSKQESGKQQRAKIAKQVKEIIANRLDVEESEIKESDNIVNDLNADSLDIVELIMDFESEFGLSFDEEDNEENNVAIIGNIIDRVCKMINKNN